MTTNNLGMKSRAEKRSSCVMMATITYLGQTARGKIVNLSLAGMAVELSQPLSARTGDKVTVASGDLGHIECIVRWIEGPRLGLEFLLNTNASAQVRSYFRFFHQEATPRRP